MAAYLCSSTKKTEFFTIKKGTKLNGEMVSEREGFSATIHSCLSLPWLCNVFDYKISVCWAFEKLVCETLNVFVNRIYLVTYGTCS